VTSSINRSSHPPQKHTQSRERGEIIEEIDQKIVRKVTYSRIDPFLYKNSRENLLR
jgi:hypothetical protein